MRSQDEFEKDIRTKKFLSGLKMLWKVHKMEVIFVEENGGKQCERKEEGVEDIE